MEATSEEDFPEIGIESRSWMMRALVHNLSGIQYVRGSIGLIEYLIHLDSITEDEPDPDISFADLLDVFFQIALSGRYVSPHQIIDTQNTTWNEDEIMSEFENLLQAANDARLAEQTDRDQSPNEHTNPEEDTNAQ